MFGQNRKTSFVRLIVRVLRINEKNPLHLYNSVWLMSMIQFLVTDQTSHLLSKMKVLRRMLFCAFFGNCII